MENLDTLCIDDLVSGRRPCISEKEYAQLKGLSRYKLQRDRSLGKGLLFQKDEAGRIWYRAKDVLADLQRKMHRSTSEYDTGAQVEHLIKARKKLRKLNLSKERRHE